MPFATFSRQSAQRVCASLGAAFALLLSGTFSPAAYAISSLQPGPSGAGDSTFIGLVETPVATSMLRVNTEFLVTGWACDRTARGWAGLDQVQVYDGQMGGGGSAIATGTVGLPRPDVATATADPDCAPSGFVATVPGSAIPALRPLTLFVYLHSPSRGWWSLMDVVNVGPTTQAQASPTGYDVSYPSCSDSLPSRPLFGIVGVNGGRTYSANPCLGQEYAWSQTSSAKGQPHTSLYLNTGNPGPTSSTRWPGPGSTAPRPCDGSWSQDCAFDYGWLAARDSVADAVGVMGTTAQTLPWWLDVEVANSWAEGDLSTNVADLAGAVAGLRAAGVSSVGIYSTHEDWVAITGASSPSSSINAPFKDLPDWVAGAFTLQDAPNYCGRTFSGGKVQYVQYYPSPSVDADFSCP